MAANFWLLWVAVSSCETIRIHWHRRVIAQIHTRALQCRLYECVSACSVCLYAIDAFTFAKIRFSGNLTFECRYMSCVCHGTAKHTRTHAQFAFAQRNGTGRSQNKIKKKIRRFSASSSTANDVCVRISRVRTQTTAMVARPMCVRAVSIDCQVPTQRLTSV